MTGRVLALSTEEDKLMTRRSASSVTMVAAIGLAAGVVLGLCSTPAAANTVVIDSGTATYSLGFVGNSTQTSDPPPAIPAGGQTPSGGFTVSGLTAVNVTSPNPAWGVFTNPWIGPSSNGNGDGALPSSGNAGPFYLNGTTPTTGAPQGFYYYTTTFTLSGGPPYFSTGTSWVSDNQGLAIFLNGHNENQQNLSNTFVNRVPFALNPSDFVTGLNTLTFITWNENYATPPGHPTPTGFNVTGTITSVPEPATIAVAISGLPVLGLFWARRRRRPI
jgi:hypothetical protein